MATPATRAALFQNIDSWAAAAAPILARDPAFIGRLGVPSMAAFVAKLKGWADQFPETTAIAVVNNELKAATAAINQTFGTTLSAPQFQAAPVTPLSTSPPLTPEQVATLGPGVELAALDPALVEAAAALAPESFAAEFLKQKPFVPAAPVAPPRGFIPTSLVSSQPTFIAEPKTFAEIAAESKAGPAPRRVVGDAVLVPLLRPPIGVVKEQIMPNGIRTFGRSGLPGLGIPPAGFIPLDPFISTAGTGLPTSGGPSGGFFDFGDFLRGGARSILTGGGLGDILRGGLAGGLGITPTLPPGTGQAAANTQRIADLLAQGFTLDQILESFKTGATVGGPLPRFTPGSLPGTAGFGGGAGGTLQLPLNGSLATLGFPIAPVLAAQATTCFRAPKGYVVVEIVGSDGVPVKVSMWKPLAKSMKLFKSRPRARISAAEWRTLKVVGRVARKAAATAKEAGFVVSISGKARRRPTAAKKRRAPC